MDADLGTSEQSAGEQSAREHSERLRPLIAIVILTLASMMLWDYPSAAFLMWPIKIFVTTLHELGHAIGCILTGGTVTGLTIVSDGEGHGGLTMSRGGMPVIYGQLGYLGTAIFGCLFIYLGRYPRAAKFVLSFMGLTIIAASIMLMSGAVLHEGRLWDGTMSVIWGVLMGGALIWSGWRLKPAAAQILLLFLAVQTALNAVTDTLTVLKISFGMVPYNTYSDASTLADLTGIPAGIWSLFWTGSAIAMLGWTIWTCYLRKPGPA